MVDNGVMVTTLREGTKCLTMGRGPDPNDVRGERAAASRRRGRLAWAALAVLLGVAAVTGSDAPQARVEVSLDAIRRHTFYLGDDALEGRAAGSAGGESSARYIAASLAQAGLLPLRTDGSFFQPVPLHGTQLEAGSELFLVSECGSGPLKHGDDYLLYTGGLGTLIPQAVPLVFAGYGIVAPEFDYNDYQDLDVAGKVVVVLSGEPDSNDPRHFAGRQPTVYATAEAKQRLALSRGARGTLIVSSVLEPPWRNWEYWRPQFALETIGLAYSVPRHLGARLHLDVADRLFCGAPFNLEAVHGMERNHTLRSFPLAASVRFRGGFQERDFVSDNVLAWLPGADPELRKSYVIVSAHYDHLGVDPKVRGDAIYNGVVDNALGVAGVLEMARALASGPRPRRSVVFLLTTAEEQGLLGASHYLEHPAVPIHRTIANLNVEGLAHHDTFKDVVGVGAELSSLGQSLRRVAERQGLSVSEAPLVLQQTDAFAFSDQAAFAEAGIPALLVKEGFRWSRLDPDQALDRFLEWGRTRYHQPSDDLKQPLDFAGSRQHAQLLFELLLDLANDTRGPVWRPGRPEALAQLRARAEGR
jgi:hypothetical protein